MKVNTTIGSSVAVILTILAVCCSSFTTAHDDESASNSTNLGAEETYAYEEYDDGDYDDSSNILNHTLAIDYDGETSQNESNDTEDDERTLPPLLDAITRSTATIVLSNGEASDNTITNVTLHSTDTQQTHHSSHACPAGCHCDNETFAQFVNCSNLGLSEIPTLPANILQLDLSHNRIARIAAGAFAMATQLRHLQLNNNQLNAITAADFSETHHLEVANFSSNHIRDIDADAFANAADLAVLSLAHNPIRLDAEQTFLNLPELQELDMEGCQLRAVYNATFRNLTGLVSMNLRNNSFDENLNVIAFMNMTELRKLKLSSVPSASIKELCDALAAIDRISADGYDVSCFEVSAGQTFEESTHTPAPKHRIVTTTPMPSINRKFTTIRPTATTSTEKSPGRQNDPPTPTTAQPQTNVRNDNVTANGTDGRQLEPNHIDLQEYNNINPKILRYVLYGVTVVALVALFVGIAYRIGLCRKRNAPRTSGATDQVQPAELQPLKDIELREVVKGTA